MVSAGTIIEDEQILPLLFASLPTQTSSYSFLNVAVAPQGLPRVLV